MYSHVCHTAPGPSDTMRQAATPMLNATSCAMSLAACMITSQAEQSMVPHVQNNPHDSHPRNFKGPVY